MSDSPAPCLNFTVLLPAIYLFSPILITRYLNIKCLVLAAKPDEFPAAHCKVVCLIQVSKFKDAVQFIEQRKLIQLVFEKSYCEYRLNQPRKALETIDGSGISPLSPSLKELRAQVLYRLEQYDECFDAYKDIIKNTHDDYEDERVSNLSAVAASLAIEGSVSKFIIIRHYIISNLYIF